MDQNWNDQNRNSQNRNGQGYTQGGGQSPYGQNVYGQNVYGQSVYGNDGASQEQVYQNAALGAGLQYQAFDGGYGQQGYYSGMEQPAQGGIAGAVSEALQQEVVAKSFIYMVAALVVTAIAAYAAPTVLYDFLASGPYNMYLLFGAELVIVLVSNAAIRRNNAALTAVLFTVYSFLNGATFGIIFWLYDIETVGAAFFMTAVMFGVMAIYGLASRKDLSSIGSLCFMGLVGVLLSTLVNAIFLKSEPFDFAISIVCILVFVGLTAYDTQKIKRNVAYANTQNTATLALAGAFELYLDFINIFLRLLRIMGRRSR